MSTELGRDGIGSDRTAAIPQTRGHRNTSITDRKAEVQTGTKRWSKGGRAQRGREQAQIERDTATTTVPKAERGRETERGSSSETSRQEQTQTLQPGRGRRHTGTQTGTHRAGQTESCMRDGYYADNQLAGG